MLMSNKYMGIIYLRLNNKLYKVASIKTGSDGSVYIANPLAPTHKGQGVDSIKFTYHPQGQSWMTSELRFSDFGAIIPDEIIRQLEGWKQSGLGIKANKLYTKDFGTNIPLSEIEDLLPLKYGISLRDLNQYADENMDKANDQKKIKIAKVIDGRDYKDLTIRFFMAGRSNLQVALKQFRLKEVLQFEHPTFPIYLIAVLSDEWTGEK